MRRIKSLLLTVCLLPSLASLAQIEDYTLPDGKVVKNPYFRDQAD